MESRVEREARRELEIDAGWREKPSKVGGRVDVAVDVSERETDRG